MSSVTEMAATGDVSPGLLVETMFAFQKTAAITAAIELDLFTAVAGGTDTAKALAAQTNASERGLRVLCDFLTVLGFLTKSGDVYQPTPSTLAFLDRRSPAYMGAAVEFISSPEMISLFLTDPTGFVRNGGSVGLANIEADNQIWIKFARGMGAFTGGSAMGLAAEVVAWPRYPKKVLDIAAGPGLFGIEIAKLAPSAEIVAVDWAAVLELSKENARKAGVADRYRALAGSAFDVNWGDEYDLILLPNFLHHFDMETCVGLLEKVKASLSSDGRVVGVEFVPNEDRVSPPFEASFAWVMLASTPKGDSYTASDLAEMGRRAGFTATTIKPLPPTPASLVFFDR
jgi:ubiquinone/menaquinone biosynthesis C-methylase UbiE